MISKNNQPGVATELRDRAEEIALEKAVLSQEDVDALSAEEIQEKLHELRVHQIELEIQREELMRAQLELEVSRDRYFNFYDLSPVGYLTLNEQGLIQETNLTTASLLGVDRNDLLKQPISRFIHRENQDIYYQRWKQLSNAGLSQAFDLRMVKTDGTEFWAHLSTAATQDANGSPVNCIVMSDITERKQAEQKIQRNESMLRRLVDILQHPSETIQDFLDYALDQAIQLTESKIGYIYHYNEDRKEFVLNTWSRDVMAECAIANPSTCYELDKTGIWGEAVRQRRPIILNDFQNINPLKKGYPEGHVQLFKFITVPIFTDGSIVGVVGLANKESNYDESDILQVSLLLEAVWKVIDRKRAEAALLKSTAVYRLVVENINDIIWTFDLSSMSFTFISPSVTRILGYADEPSTKNLDLIFTPETKRHVLKAFMKFIEGNTNEDLLVMEAEHIHKDGCPIWMEISASILKDGYGNIVGLLGISRNIHERKKAEEALRESERKYRLIAENTADLISVLDLNLRFTYVSPATIRLRGFTVEEAMAQTIEQVLTPESMRIALSAFEKEMIEEASGSADPNRTLTLELEEYTKDGATVWMEVSLSYLRDKDGKAVEILAVSRDITERKQAEEALRESETSFSQLFESAPIAMAFASDVDKYKGTTWNKAWYQTFGYSKELADGRSGNDIGLWVNPEDRDRFVEMANQQNSVADFETLLRHHDGTVRNCSIFGRFIEKAGHRLLMAIYLDVTDRKLAEDALRESEEKFRLTYNSSPDAVTISRLEDGLYVDINDGFTRATGFTREEIIGKTSLEKNIWNNPADREKMAQGLRGKGYYENLEAQFRRKDGSMITGLMSARVILLKGVPHIISITRDITERKLFESKLQQAQKFEAIGSLAGGIAHDFNNLLMGIQGRTSLMSLGVVASDPNLEHIRAIEGYVRSASNLTKQLIGLAHGGKYEVTPIDINELVLGSSAMFGRTKKEIRIHAKCSESPLVVEADRGQIEQVLLNTYINAWQAMPTTGGDIYLETKIVELDETYCMPRQIEPGSYVKISITDTGCGMNEATRQQVFDPFFTTKDKGRGTGLGLASAYGIIKNHGGTITVYSEIGHGTTFNIYLPHSGKQSRPESPVESEIKKGTEIILLVDDEELIIDVGQAMLERLGYHVIVSRGGREAIETIKNMGKEIDLVILDMVMPGMDGSTTFDSIREIQPGIPVLLSSGYAINGQAHEIMRRGCNGFIQKPYSITELSNKVYKLLNESKTRL